MKIELLSSLLGKISIQVVPLSVLASVSKANNLACKYIQFTPTNGRENNYIYTSKKFIIIEK